MKTNAILLAVIILATATILVFPGCKPALYDDDFIPYGLKGLDVYVYNNRTDKEFYAGRVEGNYSSKDETISEAQSLAYSFALEKNLRDWSYICCTVTSSSDCVTKIR